MSKGPKFVGANAARHEARLSSIGPWAECAVVDVEALRVKLSIEYVRAKGGLDYEEKIALRQKIGEIQRKKEVAARATDAKERAAETRRRRAVA